MTPPKPLPECAFRTQDFAVEMHSGFVHFAHMKFDPRPWPARRLEQARLARGFSDARAAANYFGWNYHTYAQHENGTRGLARAAARYAKALNVSEAWLLTGTGPGPQAPKFSPVPEFSWQLPLRQAIDQLARHYGVATLSAEEQGLIADMMKTLLVELGPANIVHVKSIVDALSDVSRRAQPHSP